MVGSPTNTKIECGTIISGNQASHTWDPRVCSPVTRIPHPMVHNTTYYGKCMLGGILSCGLTHTFVTPLDVAKCKMQTNPEVYKGLLSGLCTIAKLEGRSGLIRGWRPTFVGYSLQGLGKFGLYEFFKDFYGACIGEENAAKYKGMMWLAASASAEVFADILLCPMEMVKVKLQTASVGEKWPDGLIAATKRMNMQKADTKFPFGSLRPLISRQVPYTMAKFYFFEKVVQMFYDNIFTNPKQDYSKGTQLGITFASGYLAGIICAIVSHPADNLISQLGKAENKKKGFGQMSREIGVFNLFTRGLATRILMVGTLTGLQWWIYDGFKSAMGMGTSGSGSSKK